MASHSRRPASPTGSRTTARAALSLALASAASVSLLGENAQAQPRPTPEAVKAKVDDLYRQAEQATESYDGARQKADAARAAISGLQDELARKTARLNATRDSLGTIAAAQYRSGSLDPTLQLALSSSPDTYLEQAAALDQLGSRQIAVLTRLAQQRRDIEQTRAEAGGKLAALETAQTQLAARKKTVQAKLRQAQALLSTLTPPQRAAVNASDGAPAPPPPPGTWSGRHSAPRPRPPRVPPKRSPSPTGPSACPTSGAPPAPAPTTAPVSPRPPGAPPGSRCPAPPTPRSTPAPASPSPNSARATSSSSTPASPMWASTSATAR